MGDTTVLTAAQSGTSADRDLDAGQTVGEYKIDGKLGEGGFGAVYKATHPLIGKVAAIKVLSHQFSANPEMVSRFVAEAKAVNQIRHPNIIDIFSFGALPDGRQYYVMEFLDGEPLDLCIRRKQRLSLEEAMPILRGIAKALDAAHAKGIAHRDLKAENVLLASTPEGDVWPKLLDFGIAKLSGDESLRHKTRTGAPMGTPTYMSPEQSRGRDVDHRTDLYALGVLIYLMLTGVFPIDGEDYMTILMRQISDDPVPPSTHVSDLPEAVDETVAWLMRKDPAQRPPSATTALQALEGIVKPPPPVPTQVTANFRGQRFATPATEPKQSTLPPLTRRTAWLVGIGGALAFALVATVVMVRSGSRSNGQPAPAPVAAAPDATAIAVVPDAAAAVVEVDAAPSRYLTIQIAGTPPNTQVKLGKEVVGTAPGPVTIERFDAPSLVLVLAADGYKPASLQVTMDKLEYTATLDKVRRGTRPVRAGAGSAGTGEPTDDIDQFPK